MEKPFQDMIMVTWAEDEDPQRERERPFFKKITKIGEVKNPYSREFGASVFLLEGANINLNNIIESEIIEKQK